jgi:proteic killer suppression protein
LEIRFRRKKDLKCYQQLQEATRRWGEATARRYIQRINELAACQSAADLSQFPQYRFHPLKGPRTGQYALDLDAHQRLIVSFEDAAMTIVVIEEVSKHYD